MTRAEIRALRARFDESQEHFARRLGVSVAAVRCWEQGKSLPSYMARDRLAQVERSAPKEMAGAVEE